MASRPDSRAEYRTAAARALSGSGLWPMSKPSLTISAMGRRIGSAFSPPIEQLNVGIARCMPPSLATGSPRRRSCLIWQQPGRSGATTPAPSLPSRGVGCWPGARNTGGQTKGGDSATLRLYRLRPDQGLHDGRLGLRLRLNNPSGEPTRWSQVLTIPPRSSARCVLGSRRVPTSPLCSSAFDKGHRRRFGPRGGALQDPVKIGRARQAPVRL